MRKIITENEDGYNPAINSIEVKVTDSLEMQVGRLLHERGLKLVLAESCTGGLLGSRLTDVPGSSEYFLASVVAYAYEAKVALLNVSWDTLNTKGAVSRETVLEMARGIRNGMNADIAISVSGIAGPGGGTPEKPVGTTWIGFVTGKGEWAQVFHFSGDREENKKFAVEAALKLLLDGLQGDQV
ncbi:MAG TPA: CinA family protein [Anaerolineales bacterium]|nr:CinA family protein [Anaerolineales bacterium]